MKAQYWRMTVALLLLTLSIATLQFSASPSSAASEVSTTALTYPIVDTGQATCYNSDGTEITCPAAGATFYGQDAQFVGNAPSYTDNGDGTITDNVTGLVWQQSPDTDNDGDIDAADKMSYENAITYCQDLSLAGHDDWQLPAIKQLYSLIDFSGVDPSGYEETDTSRLIPFIDTDYFDFAYGDTDAGERIIDSQYASSTLYVGGDMEQLLFGVNFADGRIKGYGLSLFGQEKTFSVACVRESNNYGVNDFTDNGDDTITDEATGLMWAQEDSDAGMNWEAALAWAQEKNANNYLGYSDWRLPDVKELQSIVDYSRAPDATDPADEGPALDPLFSVSTITNEAGNSDYPYYWSSTSARFQARGDFYYVWYVAAGRAVNNEGLDFHGAGAVRFDTKVEGGPAGEDTERIYNYIRLARNIDSGTVVTPENNHKIYLPIVTRQM